MVGENHISLFLTRGSTHWQQLFRVWQIEAAGINGAGMRPCFFFESQAIHVLAVWSVGRSAGQSAYLTMHHGASECFVAGALDYCVRAQAKW